MPVGVAKPFTVYNQVLIVISLEKKFNSGNTTKCILLYQLYWLELVIQSFQIVQELLFQSVAIATKFKILVLLFVGRVVLSRGVCDECYLASCPHEAIVASTAAIVKEYTPFLHRAFYGLSHRL